jgi:hypothetical protein
VKGPKPAAVFGKIGREGLRGSGNTAQYTADSWTEGTLVWQSSVFFISSK